MRTQSTALVCSLVLLLAVLASAQDAGEYFRRARKAEKAGEFVQAYLWYAQAAGLDPDNRKYWGAAHAVRTRALTKARSVPVAPVRPASVPAAGDAKPYPLAVITDADLTEARKAQPPPRLKADPARKDFNLRADARQLFTEVAKAYGLDIVFDVDYQAGGPVLFRLQNADYREALHALEAVTSTFLVPLGEKLLFAVKDTYQKRAEADATMVTVVPYPKGMTVQDAQEVGRTVAQIIELARIGVEGSRGLIVLRDRVSKVQAAKQLLLQLMYGRPQVGVEVDLIDSTRRASSSYGLDLMSSSALAVFGRPTGDARGPRLLPNIPTGFAKFLVFGGGRTFLGLGVADARMFASMSESESRNLLRASLRALDGTPATLHIGEKYPILTLGYFGAATGEGQVYTPPPSVNFEDLGLVLKITPRIHSRDDISMLVEAEYKVLAGGAINGIPIINNRKLNSVVRLKSGETAVLAGLVTVNEARTLSGVAGLSQLPMLGPLLRQNTRSRDESEALILIRPHVLDLPPTEFPTTLLYTGTEGRPASLL